MKSYTIQISEMAYQSLIERAATENSTPEQVIEQILTGSMACSPRRLDNTSQPYAILTSTTDALDAIHRLTNLFADVTINGLEQVLNDPMLELANANLDTELP